MAHMRIAINGMGRIGRLLFRRLVQCPGIEVAAVNDIMDAENLAYLLKYDSVYGTAPFELLLQNNQFIIGEQAIPVFREPNPLLLPWKELGVDVVLECTGQFSNLSSAQKHLDAGAKKVLLSTTGSVDIPLLIYGYNQQLLSDNIQIVSPGGCMTNCVTTVLLVLKAECIESMQLNVIHSYTSRQQLVDAPHADFRRGRAAAESIIPVPVDLADSLERLFPLLQNKMAATTTRVPVANGALADFTFLLKKTLTKETINTLFEKAAESYLNGILAYTEEALVSLDVKGNAHSAVVDGSLTSVAGRQVKVFALFDNEYGYTSRIIDWLRYWNTAKQSLSLQQ